MKAVDDALKVTLEAIPGIGALAPGGVHNIVRRQGSAFPVVVFSLAPSVGDSPRYGGADGIEHLSYDVKIIAPISAQAGVGDLVELVHAALQGQPLTLAGLDHMQTLRERRIPNYPETTNGVTYLHRGGTYTVSVSHPV
ncbi:MAG: hypothetical protein JWL76_2136 [Thermoleophilia bacterium]|nr:hypothetical protein [Thermoleophilia bacterium]